jgi:hypothetical protein
MDMITLSTSWKSRDFRDGDALVQAVVDAGFDGIELEYRIQAPVFQQMVPALERSGLTFPAQKAAEICFSFLIRTKRSGARRSNGAPQP